MAKKHPAPKEAAPSRNGTRAPNHSAAWLTKQREKLESQRDRLRQNINSETDQLKVFGTTEPREDADIAEESWEDEEVSRTVEVLQTRFSQIGEALERLRSGRYGICDDCKKAIPRERLEAVPSAIRCVACQEKHEAKTAKRSEPY
jgi:DnaK suppressor protein